MRKRIFSVAMALCMVLGLLPMTAWAASVTSVKIGTAELNSTNKYYHNGTGGAQGYANGNSTGANAIFEDGTLKLNGLNVTNGQIQWENYNLIIELVEGSTNIVNNTSGAAIVGENGNPANGYGPSLTIKGSGSLKATGKTSGIWVWHNITIKDATVNAIGGEKMGIGIAYSGKISIDGSAKVSAKSNAIGMGREYNKFYDSSNVTNPISITVDERATLEVTGTSVASVAFGAVKDGNQGMPVTLIKADGAQVVVGDSATSTTSWNSSADALTGKKYVKVGTDTIPAIGDALAAPTYTVSFYNGGGSGDMTSATGVSGTYTLPECEFTPADGYRFAGWSVPSMEGTQPVGKEITVSGNITVTANWEPIPKHTVTITAEAGGSVKFDGDTTSATSKDVQKGNTVTVVATAADGYTFNGWYVGGTQVSSEKTYGHTVTEEVTLEAKFSKITYTVSFAAGTNGSGIMEDKTGISGTYALPNCGFTPADGYRFAGWSVPSMEGTQPVGKEITVSGNINVTALWEAIPEHTVTINAEAGGSVTINGDAVASKAVEEGTAVTVVATPTAGYTFDGWYDGDDNKVSAAASYNFAVTKAVTLQAKFSADPVTNYTVTIGSAEHGTVTGGGSYPAGTRVEVKATPDVGYDFKGWMVGDAVAVTSEENPYVIDSIGSGVKLTPVFERNSVVLLQINASPASMRGKGTVTLTVANTTGNPVTVTCDDTDYNPTDNGDGTYSVYLPNRTQTYTFTATAGDQTATCTVDVRKKSSDSTDSSSSGGSGSEKPAEKPEEKPAEKPEEKPVDKPEVKPEEVSKQEKIVLAIGQKVAVIFGNPMVNDVAPVVRNDRAMLAYPFCSGSIGRHSHME